MVKTGSTINRLWLAAVPIVFRVIFRWQIDNVFLEIIVLSQIVTITVENCM